MVGLSSDVFVLALSALHEGIPVPATVNVEEPHPTPVHNQSWIEIRSPGLILKNERFLPLSAAIKGVGSQDHLMDRCLEWTRKPNAQETTVVEASYAGSVVEAVMVAPIVGVLVGVGEDD